ncbi:MAG: hypothetical protein GKR91_14565 [Pseudomonadales bacterium]|nr:hypothetical protein [Pseudomonadales bacterium]
MKMNFKVITLCLAALGSLAIVKAQISTGNGESNWINVEDVKRNGGTLTFSEVQIEGNGFLIIHPFENGAINGDRVVASTFLHDGNNENVEITVHRGLESGEPFFVMLHSDSNNNGALDFIFIDDQNVMDLAVIEDSTMIGHAIPAP